MPVPAYDAWEHHGPQGRGLLRELDPGRLYEIQVDYRHFYRLRRPQRIDVVVDRAPDSETSVSVYLDGAPVTHPVAHAHVVDPGGGGADHEWMESASDLDASAPELVRDEVRALARGYHQYVACSEAACAPVGAATGPDGSPDRELRYATWADAQNAAARPASLPVTHIAVSYATARVGDSEFPGTLTRTEGSAPVFSYGDAAGQNRTTTDFTVLSESV